MPPPRQRSPHPAQWNFVPSCCSQPVAKSPSQSAKPGSQLSIMHAPPAQRTEATRGPGVQLTPQAPQLVTSSIVSVSQPLT